MQINHNRIGKFLDQIVTETEDIEEILTSSDTDILGSDHLLKSLKYSLIVVSEAIASTLQHVLAKEHRISVGGYSEVFSKAEQQKLLSSQLLNNLGQFVRFRNMLVHQYWRVDDTQFLSDLRRGVQDFKNFVREIETFLEHRISGCGLDALLDGH